MHSRHSDGKATIAQMAKAAKAMGYEYILMTDHSQSLKVANGMTVEEVEEALDEIVEVNRKMKDFRVLSGAEVDILPDGSLDYPDKVLEKFDVVLASIHSRLDDPVEKMTPRLIRAIENPYVRMIGHPTGRRFGYREASAIDMEKVMKAAAKHRTALEINAHYERLDLNDIHARMAVEHGVMLSLGTDAHSMEGLDNMRFGVAVARRAWLEPKHILNTYPLDKLLEWCQNR